jgi:DNA-binding MarR family transcriptional regulator
MISTEFGGYFCLAFRVVEYRSWRLPMVQLPGLDSIEQTCWQEYLGSSMRLFAILDRRFHDKHGLTLVEVRLLELLAASDTGAVRKIELCRSLVVTQDRLSTLFRRLQPKGFVAQAPTRYDRRGIMLSITEAGRMQLAAARITMTDVARTHYLSRMTHRQMVALSDSHRRINDPLREPKSLKRAE